MAMNVRNRTTKEHTETLAGLTGETKTRAVTKALRDRLERIRRQRSGRSLAEELDDVALHCASLPVLDDGRTDEIPGYDENGLPP